MNCKGAVAFRRSGFAGLFAISPMKNRGMPLPSGLATAVCAGET